MPTTVAEERKAPQKPHDRLAAIDEELSVLAAERENVFVDECDHWRGRGYEAYIVPSKKGIELRHCVLVSEFLCSYSSDTGWRSSWVVEQQYVGYDDDYELGVYADGPFVWIRRGEFVVTLTDGKRAVVVRVRKTKPTKKQLSRSHARIRNAARREHMRVSIHGDVVKLVSPMNDIVFEGDASSAALWLAGITADTVIVPEVIGR
ncbi:MAG: hypothetical protein B7X41_20260 [Microbacterium sp. 14-71-5]|jgi:hypothetical protein|uniref:hypothetical protein n=1 Tax=Microbacterium sp. 13-71-7 TaxID=1970399 RepID=UPI000BC3D7BB|nr:hypothetical protein [Microbacterium sp. 13-71-7]OZB78170.1 MAG: hypothetical protein B7X41_20260 [Microbacterium sp. 14-71-5]OZB85381.1 MAG: hypothetical protein B7X32_03555 [Microbacterium sp. 13-71-7]